MLKLQILVNPDTGMIEDAKFKTFGCGSAIASSQLATEWLKGKTIDEAMGIKNTAIVEELALPPVKVHCSVLAEDAIKAAIQNYQQKTPPLRRESEAAGSPRRPPAQGRHRRYHGRTPTAPERHAGGARSRQGSACATR